MGGRWDIAADTRRALPGGRLGLQRSTHTRPTAMPIRAARGPLTPQTADPSLLVVVQPSSARTLDPVRRDNSFAEKQESHPARLLVVPRRRLRPPS
jgi:hypothetical protein